MKKVIAVDMDLTLTKEEVKDVINKSFIQIEKEMLFLKPNTAMIDIVNRLAKKNEIIIFTTRADYFKKVTKKWLKLNKVKYNEIIFGKPYYDYIIDDKSILLRQTEDVLYEKI